jgi:hypothetical protein
MFPTPRALLALCITLLPFALRAEPTAAEPRTYEWLQTLPGDFIVHNQDTCTDYRRDGKVVYRLINRSSYVSHKSDRAAQPVNTHLIEFVANGKAFASVAIDAAATPNWRLTCGYPLYVECGGAGDMTPTGRAFRVCVPKLDYFEYVEVIANHVVDKPMSAEVYAANKKYGFEQVERGYINTENEGR